MSIEMKIIYYGNRYVKNNFNNEAISPIVGVILMVALTLSFGAFAQYYFTNMLPESNNSSTNWVHNITENPFNNLNNPNQINPLPDKNNTIPEQNQNWTKNNTIPSP